MVKVWGLSFSRGLQGARIPSHGFSNPKGVGDQGVSWGPRTPSLKKILASSQLYVKGIWEGAKKFSKEGVQGPMEKGGPPLLQDYPCFNSIRIIVLVCFNSIIFNFQNYSSYYQTMEAWPKELNSYNYVVYLSFLLHLMQANFLETSWNKFSISI